MVYRDSHWRDNKASPRKCVGALFVTRWFAGLLFGVTANDPPVFLAGIIALAAVGSAANYIPARRAGNVDPNQALRAE